MTNTIKSPVDFKPRNKFGLFDDIEYKFNDFGIDWRAMVDEEYLFPNKSWFTLRQKPIPDSIEGLNDNQLIVKLGGFKRLAKLRGFNSISYRFGESSNDYVRMVCKIDFIGNFETNMQPVSFESTANATNENCSSFTVNFKETIAENRSFVRCVRNFLGIDVVGADEIGDKDGKEEPAAESNAKMPSAQQTLLKALLSINIKDFASFTEYVKGLISENKFNPPANWLEWKSTKDVSAKDARTLIGIIKS